MKAAVVVVLFMLVREACVVCGVCVFVCLCVLTLMLYLECGFFQDLHGIELITVRRGYLSYQKHLCTHTHIKHAFTLQC